MLIKYLLPIRVLQIRQPSVLAYLGIIIKYLDLSASAEPSWLHNPLILCAIHVALNKALLELSHDLLDKLISIDPIRILSIMLGLKRFVFEKVLGHLLVNLLEPLFSLDEFDVRFRVVTPQHKRML